MGALGRRMLAYEKVYRQLAKPISLHKGKGMIRTWQQGKLGVGDESIQLNGELGRKKDITITPHNQRRRSDLLEIICCIL